MLFESLNPCIRVRCICLIIHVTDTDVIILAVAVSSTLDNSDPILPSLAAWGWEIIDDNSPWTPCWTTLSEASKAYQEPLRCGCKKSCTKRCKCFKVN